MTDEVKAALKVVRDRKNHYGNENDRADRILANAFAALHPPDDDEPITMEYCREHIADFDKNAWIFKETVVTMKINFIIGNTTRGQLRRLLSALEE